MFQISPKKLPLIAGLAAFALFACPNAPASAGEYEVWSCRGPDGQPLSTDAWVPVTDGAVPGDVSFSDDCSSGGPVLLSLTDLGTGPRSPRLNLNFDLPPGAVITGYALNRAVRAAASFSGGPSHTYVSAVRESTAGVTEDWGCASSLAPPYFNCSFDGSPSDPDDPSNLQIRSGAAFDGLRAWVGCISSGCQAPLVPPAGYFYLWGSQVTIEDNSFPNVVSLGGNLAEGEPVRGRANLFVRARDSISGVASMDLEIDGQQVETQQVGTQACQEPYEVARPCLADAGLIFTVDTDELGAGQHVATGRVTDAAGNQTPFGPVAFEVESPDPGPPVPDNGIPAVHDPTINLRGGSTWHRPGSAAAIDGRLVTDTGVAVAGATLGVRLTRLAVARPSTVVRPDVVTQADGTFTIPVPGQGARDVEISFAPVAGGATTSTAVVRVRSRLRVSLKPRPRRVRIGNRVRFSGRLIGAGPSAAGVPVEIQARVGGRWETVASVRSRAGGNWSWNYRFRFVSRNALFSFRAVVRATPGWPWPQVTSPVRRVRISVGRR